MLLPHQATSMKMTTAVVKTFLEENDHCLACQITPIRERPGEGHAPV
jgi:hypothetical protein